LTALVLALAPESAFAQDGPGCPRPSAWTVHFWLHETPDDPESPVTFKLALYLLGQTGDCSQTGWYIDSLEIRQVDPNSGPDRVWMLDDPDVPTQDGLWWVTHADVTNPDPSEFVMPPQLTGLAISQDPYVEDLDFDFEGVSYTPPTPPNSPPFDVTAALNLWLQLEGGEDPLADSAGDPADADPPTG